MDSPLSFRPIYLLNEMEKLLERIIANRISNHLSYTDPVISVWILDRAIDAIDRIVILAQSAVSQGGVALAVSIEHNHKSPR